MSLIAVEDLPMRDLVKLFRKQVSLHGVSKFVPLLVDGNMEGDDKDDDFSDSDVNSAADTPSIGESVDILSDSSYFDEESDNDGFFGDSDDQSDVNSDGADHSPDGSVIGEAIGPGEDANTLHLHPPPMFLTRHCPPFATIQPTLDGECDCNDFGMDSCGRTDDFQFFSELKLGEEYNISLNSVSSVERLPSNILRKRLYKMLFHATDFGLLEKNERRKLPNCVVARIRQIYPSSTGTYMGYREN